MNNHRNADMYKQWLANPNNRMVEEYVTYNIDRERNYNHLFWLTKRVPMTSISMPLVNNQNCAYAELYFTERPTDLHLLGARIDKMGNFVRNKKGGYVYGDVACYGCREKLKLYHLCYMHYQYRRSIHYGDFGIEESLCSFCGNYNIVWLNKKLYYDSNTEHLYENVPHPMFKFKSKM
ncbi:hypothetical protein [Spodoptera cosmioides nucleopolyhedrovirus]|uniref:Uncharacterized protein n=1 Tax=Spodoptera cosmioides nucleopolyhedrovirus TaxID=2605774 RepID=A0A6B7KIB7_9ABAC|nr:hypothetical protein [Spodoptera cosmioides nucleopolyhedrovirus]